MPNEIGRATYGERMKGGSRKAATPKAKGKGKAKAKAPKAESKGGDA